MLAIVDTKPRDVESIRTMDFIPEELRQNADTLESLLSKYYEFLNTEGLPSYELNSVRHLNDVDKVSRRYFSQIHSLIGNSVPLSRVIDQVELYKIIIKYYNSRGSEDSIHSFFRIFFGAVISVFYPKDFLFELSSGEKSLLSNKNKICDGKYWQNYSYVISSDLSFDEWKDQYVKLVHPIGLKLFAAISFLEVALTEWLSYIDYESESWLMNILPPGLLPLGEGYHSPRYQPGFIYTNFLNFLFEGPVPEEDLIRYVEIFSKILSESNYVRSGVAYQYLNTSEKFMDETPINEGLLDIKIFDSYLQKEDQYLFNISTVIITS